MVQKPIDIVAKNNIAGRQEIWNYIRKHKQFSVKEVAWELDIKVTNTKVFIIALYKAGYLIRESQPSEGNFPKYIYTLIKNSDRQHPILTKNGKESKRCMTGRDRMWAVFKTQKRFTVKDICYMADVGHWDAKRYINALVRAQYINTVHKTSTANHTIYRPNKRKIAGPHALKIQANKQIFDPNTKQVVWQPEHLRKESEDA